MQARTLLLVLLVACGCLQAQDTPVALSVGKVYCGDGTVFEPGVVLFQNGKILAVGCAGLKVPSNAESKSMPEATVTAGLIDACSRAGSSGAGVEQGSETLAELDCVDECDLWSREMRELAREGVTSVALCADSQSVIGGASAVVRTGEGSDGRVLLKSGDLRASFSDSAERGNGRPFGQKAPSRMTRRPTTLMGTVYVFREAFGAARRHAVGLDPIRVRPTNPVTKAGLARMAEVLEGKRRLRVLAEQEHEIGTAFRLTREFGVPFILEGGNEAYRYVAQLAKSKTPVIYGPVERSGEEHRRSTPRILLDGGVSLALSSMNGRGENGLARQAMRAMRWGLSREEALAATTTTPAEILGLGNRVGQVRAGFDADIVVWSGEPFAATSRQVTVYVGGLAASGRAF